VATWSTHIIQDPRLAHAISDFVDREAAAMTDYQADQRERCNFDALPEHAADAAAALNLDTGSNPLNQTP